MLEDCTSLCSNSTNAADQVGLLSTIATKVTGLLPFSVSKHSKHNKALRNLTGTVILPFCLLLGPDALPNDSEE
jgi:hypothetical protein